MTLNMGQGLKERGRTRRLPVALLGLVFGVLVCSAGVGCTSPGQSTSASLEAMRPLLNSERIELKFGSYGLDVLERDSVLRVSHLYSVHEGEKVGRTLAVVLYPDHPDAALAQEHAMIVEGGSIGAVFKQHGWTVKKRHAYFGELALQPSYRRVRDLMKNPGVSHLAIHVYVLAVEKGSSSFDYATITEVHHPDYLTLDDLNAIYPDEALRHSRMDSEIRSILEVVAKEL